MKSLIEFWKDKETKENVQAYLIEFCKKEALDELFGEGDSNLTNATSIAKARVVIDKAFENLDTLFETKKQKKEQINEAR